MQPEVALLYGLEIVSMKLQCVSLDAFEELLEGVVKVVGYRILSRLMIRLAVTVVLAIEDLSIMSSRHFRSLSKRCRPSGVISLLKKRDLLEGSSFAAWSDVRSCYFTLPSHPTYLQLNFQSMTTSSTINQGPQ